MRTYVVGPASPPHRTLALRSWESLRPAGTPHPPQLACTFTFSKNIKNKTLVSQSLLNFVPESQTLSQILDTIEQPSKSIPPSSGPWVNHTRFPPCLSPQTLCPQFRNSIPQPELGFTPFSLRYLNSQSFPSLNITVINTMSARFYTIL